MMSRHAFTLTELIAVLCILAALAGVLVPMCSDQVSVAASVTTTRTLDQAAQALERYWNDTKFLTLDGVTTVATDANRFDIQWLFVNPVTGDQTIGFNANLRSGWNGPYLFSSTTDPAQINWGLIDAWQQALTVQVVAPAAQLKDVRIVSPGANGLVDIPSGTATSALTTGNVGDDLYVAIALR